MRTKHKFFFIFGIFMICLNINIWTNANPVLRFNVPYPVSTTDSITPTAEDTNVYKFVDKMPEFPGGTASLNAFLVNEIRYPEVARQNNITGTVLIQFVVEKDGSVDNATVLAPLFTDCDKEALRAILAMPKWKPGYKDGQLVRCYYVIPIKFWLSGENPKSRHKAKKDK